MLTTMTVYKIMTWQQNTVDTRCRRDARKGGCLSDPVRAWNAGRAFALAEDIVLQMSQNMHHTGTILQFDASFIKIGWTVYFQAG